MSAGNGTSAKEYFAESIWGVRASPRVSYSKSNLPRGGGRDQLGRPYKVRGKMYYPKEDRNYEKVGYASWYGDAFHGRLTANGEIYDQMHLTAAHPTMPLPSYARVTNMQNGNSVIVRVNDRGPYSHGRLIDLSRRAAEMLNYTHIGTAKVKVEYVGRAPLEGRDDTYLLASYKPGNAASGPDVGLPAGVMIAMNGPTPGASVGATRAAAFPGTLTGATRARMATAGQAVTNEAVDIVLPVRGPIAPQRPALKAITGKKNVLAALSYAPRRGANFAADAFDALEGRSSRVAVGEGERGQVTDDSASSYGAEPFVAVGTFADKAEAQHVRERLAVFGRTTFEASLIDGAEVFSVDLYSDGRNSLDSLLTAAWRNGAPDAIAVRD